LRKKNNVNFAEHLNQKKDGTVRPKLVVQFVRNNQLENTDSIMVSQLNFNRFLLE